MENRFGSNSKNSNSDSRLTGNLQDSSILAGIVFGPRKRTEHLDEIQTRLREIEDIANYLLELIKEVRQMSKLLKRTVVDESDPVGYALVHLMPDHVICKCGTEMVKVPCDDNEKACLRWVCPNCGAEIIVKSPERGDYV